MYRFRFFVIYVVDGYVLGVDFRGSIRSLCAVVGRDREAGRAGRSLLTFAITVVCRLFDLTMRASKESLSVGTIEEGLAY